MLTKNILRRCALLAVPFGLGILALHAQPVRIAGRIDTTRRAPLECCRAPQARPEYDRGPADASFPLDGLTLHVRPSPSQQAALERLLAEQQDPASPNYRKWLTPEQYADRFGLSPADIAKVVEWLRSEGFEVKGNARGRMWVTFSGTAGLLRSAFHAGIRRYAVDGVMHFANSGNLTIPAALQGIVAGVSGLDDFEPQPSPGKLPELTQSSGRHNLAPDDIATIYDIAQVYQAGIDGSGQSIVVVGNTSIDLADIRAFRSKFNLPALDPQVILTPNYPDPGRNSSSLSEADLDIEWSGAVARKANILYVYSSTTYNAVRYAIDQKLAPVITRSFGGSCEPDYAPEYIGTIQAFQTLAQQAAAEGITWVNSAGDTGPAGCDANGAAIAQGGLAVQFPASVPEITAVGGTQFAEGNGNYWRATNDANSASALSYIPEAVWNGSASALWAGGSGVSIVFAKPPWQAGPGVPDDGMRDVPDISMAASTDGYYVYTGGAAGYYGGTSLSTPVFAGVVALLNQYLTVIGGQKQPGLGNLNPTLYRLAQTAPESFHDVVNGDNKVSCSAGSPDCRNGVIGYTAGPGYDVATGLGSPDVLKLLLNWPNKPASESLVVVSITPNPVYQQQADSLGSQWFFKIVLNEEAGVATTLTSLSIDGAARDPSTIASWFGTQTIPANGSISAHLGTGGLTAPRTRSFTFAGADSSGRQWSRDASVLFTGPLVAPSVGGVSNAASGQLVYAPGMIMSIYGSQLASSPQAAAAIPLLDVMQGFSAKVNGVFAPLYYVSPNQVNVQIPYETAAGNATLVVDNGQQTAAAFSFRVAASAPGVFVDGTGAPVPYPKGSRGQVLILFITGEGQVTPALATGATPSPSTPVSRLPAPQLPVKMSIAGVSANILFSGIPSGLVGVTQINFQVPATAPLGLQPLVVSVGDTNSAPVNFTVTQ